MKTILVTGGAGFIGSHVCERLLSMGKKVICVDNFNDYYDPRVKEDNASIMSGNPNFKLYRADITDSDKMAEVFRENKIDSVIHLAARAGVRASFADPALYETVNIHGTKVLLELAKEHRVSKFLFCSSSSVYGTNKKVPFSENDKIENMISPYAQTKRKAELLCKEYHDKYGLSICCLRLFTVYGPRGRPDMAPYKFTKNVMEGKPIELYGDGSFKRDFTFVTDIVDGIISALTKDIGFDIINLGDSKPVSISYFISLIEKATGKKAVVKKMPVAEGDVPLTYADISKARKLLDYNPKVNIEEGIKLFVDWYGRAENKRTTPGI